MIYLSVHFERVLVSTLVSCSFKILLERGVYIIYWFVYRDACRMTDSSGSDSCVCLSSKLYGLS